MESYIVRVYRRGAARARRIVGVVEEVGVEGTQPFADLDALWAILVRPAARGRASRRRRARGPVSKSLRGGPR